VRKLDLAGLWERAWFRPAGPAGVLAARTLLAAQALWIVLSRPDLPELTSWPSEFWLGAADVLRVRFGWLGLASGAERSLFALLHASLLCALLGIFPRAACALSGLLLYHFAPAEEIIAGIPHTAFGGLTLPVTGLLVLSFAAAPRWREAAPTPEHRWPLVLIQLLFSFSYFFPGLAKLRFAGLDWFSADNIRSWLILNEPITQAAWARWLASSAPACGAVAAATLALELLFPLAVFSRAAARILLPLALAFHLGILATLGYAFLSLPLLLLYLDWDRIARRVGFGRLSEPGEARPSDGGPC
jgi:hypothetical protein